MIKSTLYQLLGIVLLLVTSGCGRRISPAPIAGMDEIYVERMSDFPDMIEEYVNHIVLKTPDSIPINGIGQLRIADDKLFVCDPNGRYFNIFDRDGNFIRHINNQGRGPKEYLSINSFAIDLLNRKIVVGGHNKILIYSINGDFEKVINAETPIFQLVPFGKEQFIHINDGIENRLPQEVQPYNLSVLNAEGKVVKTLLSDHTPENLFLLHTRSQGLEDGSILFKPILSDTIYRISEQGIELVYHYNFNLKGFSKLSADDQKKIDKGSIGQPSLFATKESEKYICQTGEFINGERILFSTFGNATVYFVFYDKQTQKCVTVPRFQNIGSSLDLKTASAEEVEKALLNHIVAVQDHQIWIEVSDAFCTYAQNRLKEGRLKELVTKIASSGAPNILICKLKPIE